MPCTQVSSDAVMLGLVLADESLATDATVGLSLSEADGVVTR